MTATTTVTGIARVDVGDQIGWWAEEHDAIVAHLADQFGAATPGTALPEPREPAVLREGLRRVAPKLAALTDRVRAEFDEHGACAVEVPALGLAAADIDERRKATFALASLIGDVMANHPMDFAVWDVKTRDADLASGGPSHSTTTRAAHYHTDAGYLPHPPRFFLLYAARAAGCGGGLSLIRDGRVLRDQLAQSEQGRRAMRLLSHELPRRVPQQFHSVSQVDEHGCAFAPVYTERPSWRWARRNIRIGLENHPDHATPEVWEAVEMVKELLEHGDDEFSTALPTDGVLIVDNHLAFHARTVFTDAERHLFRIRFHDPAPASP